jgi:hypothetical protein
MKNKTYAHAPNMYALTTACLALTGFACTKSDSLGQAGNKDGGTDTIGKDDTVDTVFCQLNDGRRVPAGAAFAAEDGCNCCVCTSSGVGECQGAKCSFGDAAVASTSPGGCQSDQDCKDQGSSLCVFDQGCDSPRGTCMSVGNGVCPLFAVSNLAPFPYCGCDGVTYPITNDLQYPYKPYRHVGACGPNDRADGGPSTPDVPSEARNDGGVDAATDSSICGAGSPVHYSAPGCGTDAVPICGSYSQDACTAIISYCGCDGRTTIQGACGTSPSPYLYVGACKQDGGPSTPDVPASDAPAAFCQLSDGRRIQAGAAYANGNCNCCVCTSSGTTACQALPCYDAGPPGSCQSDQDCNHGNGVCAFDPGCDSPRGTCMSNGACSLFLVSDMMPFEYCGCDGVTYAIVNSSTSPREYPYKPYSHYGACQ